MAGKKSKDPSFTSPKGTFKFPRLTEPDFKYKAEGEYSLKLIVPRPEAQPLIDKLQPLWDEAIDAGKAAFKELPVATRKKMEAQGKGFTANPFFSPVYGDDEEETGEVEFKFSMTHSGEYKKGPKAGQKWTRSPSLFDAKGKPLPKSVQIWGGTLGRVSFEVAPYWVPGQASAGLSLRLKAVQVIDLVSGGQRSASSYGFTEEDGYQAPDDEPEGTEADSPDAGEATDEDDDF
ncbi:DUF2815 family protein [Azorhizobium caulinodans]|nr:DUF2815 family protein [Azorhizobium caulinodans]